MRKPQFHSLEDFLASQPTDVDGTLDDGWGFHFPVKGREIEAAVLFADISGFSTRTIDMTPAETLIFVQNFFAWITAEALHGRHGIVDKYIGDEIMVIFSEEFGSDDPVVDAVRTAADMSRSDVHAYHPHMGIAFGKVIVGYAGTSMRYNVSAFGTPVALAARCAGVRPDPGVGVVSASIVMPADTWGGRLLDRVIPPEGGTESLIRRFVISPPRSIALKGVGEVDLCEIHNVNTWMPGTSAENRARLGLAELRRQNRYWPRA